MKCMVKVIGMLLMLFCTAGAEGLLQVSGKTIVDGTGKEIILRGIGLGGWMLPEGYMFQMSSFANAPWEIKQKVASLVGEANADTFWQAFRKNFVQRKDIEHLAQLGFNSVRLPMHWEFYMNPDGTARETGYTITDSLLRWCADHSLYLILDLHAAPGGQSANNISDYNPSYPSLWESESNKQKTILLWKAIAERYRNEPWIGGYDILNEPAWDLPPNNQPLRDLSVAITNAIRSVDTSHIIFVEGNWYATDFNGMTPAWDAKMVWSFHKYWNSNDIGAINYLLSLRNSTNRPLWLGESGENSNQWFADCIALLESNKIGWSWWTLKKFGGMNSLYNVPVTAEFNGLLNYWKGQSVKPSVAYAMKGLMDMAEGLRAEKCEFNRGVADAMLRQPFDNSTRPYAENTVPGTLFLTNYDMGKNGVAYKDIVFTNTDNKSVWNNGWSYRNDGVDIERCNDAVTNGYNVGWIDNGEFMLYTVDVKQSGKYLLTLRAAVNASGGYVGLSWDGATQVLTALPVTGGWQSWGNVNLGTTELTAGKHTLRLSTFFGGFNLNYVNLVYLGPLSVASPIVTPRAYGLEQNHPNPFNPSTSIRYTMTRPGHVAMSVHDQLGRQVATLVDGTLPAGTHEVQFQPSHLASGIYFCRLMTGEGISVKKMIFAQ